MPEKGENAFVAWLTRRFPADAARVTVGIGDDMAVMRVDHGLIAITADMLLDGVHFDTTLHPLPLIGRKAIACSLSDCAAMGCYPRGATISIALPNSFTLNDVQAMYEGMAAIADEFDCRIIGGDTTSWPGKLAIDVAMLAEPMSDRGPILRSDAQPGDMLFVSGPLGGSIHGRHLSFTPRLALARQLARCAGLHAMMDLSDGLSMDLHRMCVASGCAAEIEAAQLDRAISDTVSCLHAATENRIVAREDGHHTVDQSESARDHALNDGEDFELLIAGTLELADLAPELIPVGRVVAQHDAGPTRVILITTRGRQAIEPRGYEHFK